MNAIRNPFTYRMPVIKLAVKELQSAKFYAILLVLVALAGIFNLSPVVSSLMKNVVIKNIGEISTSMYARSGSARDIQAAVDWVVANGSIGNVYIPQGTFNLVEPGEPWVTVNIPAGVNLFGAPTERDANGQVVEWRTVLVMPYEVGGTWGNVPRWFTITGSGDPNKSTRFSDIKLVGYRDFDPNSTSINQAIQLREVVNFRIDHCYFRDTVAGISVGGSPNSASCGVIDHCKLVNTRARVLPYVYDCDVGYGVCIVRPGTTFWEDDVNKVLGQYTDHTVFIEDCYFSKWRHCVSANDGTHYVWRHNIVENDVGYGSIDAHGTYNYVGTRAIEVYNNQFINAVGTEQGMPEDVIWLRGGAAVIFNNMVQGYQHRFVGMIREGDVEKCWPHDVWIWNNTLVDGIPIVTVFEDSGKGEPVEGEDYFLYAKSDYTPYPYPHPLTLEAKS